MRFFIFVFGKETYFLVYAIITSQGPLVYGKPL